MTQLSRLACLCFLTSCLCGCVCVTNTLFFLFFFQIFSSISSIFGIGVIIRTLRKVEGVSLFKVPTLLHRNGNNLETLDRYNRCLEIYQKLSMFPFIIYLGFPSESTIIANYAPRFISQGTLWLW